jgi:hypothetical protein
MKHCIGRKPSDTVYEYSFLNVNICYTQNSLSLFFSIYVSLVILYEKDKDK